MEVINIMGSVLKVRDRTTGKIRDVLVDREDYDRLKDYKYLTDKNSKEPFREESSEVDNIVKRQRIALKRDVMNFNLGDPRRVCYVNKTELFDCRKSNLKCRADETTSTLVGKPAKKATKKVKATKIADVVVSTMPLCNNDTFVELHAFTVEAPTCTNTDVVAPTTTTESLDDSVPTPTSSKLLLPDNFEVKKALADQLGEEGTLDLISVDTLLVAWAEKQKKRA